MGKLIDLTGQKFGRLTVVKRVNNIYTPSGTQETMWLCRCDCGNEIITRARRLKDGNKKSCGCLAEESRTKHGYMKNKKQVRLYSIWTKMKSRCYNINDKDYINYGKRGISICTEWLHDYKAFSDWAYNNGYNDIAKRGICTIDRINVNGDYSPNNCRWVNQKVQNNNRRDNVNITYNNETHSLKEWSLLLNINYNTLYNRIYTYKWSINKAFNMQVQTRSIN